jgi:hypothetical protein
MRLANNLDPPARTVSWLRFDRDFHVLTKRCQKTHQAFVGKVFQAAVEESGNLGLIDLHECCGGYLGQTLSLDDLTDTARKLSLRQLLLGLGEPKIGENIPATRSHRDD